MQKAVNEYLRKQIRFNQMDSLTGEMIQIDLNPSMEVRVR